MPAPPAFPDGLRSLRYTGTNKKPNEEVKVDMLDYADYVVSRGDGGGGGYGRKLVAKAKYTMHRYMNVEIRRFSLKTLSRLHFEAE